MDYIDVIHYYRLYFSELTLEVFKAVYFAIVVHFYLSSRTFLKISKVSHSNGSANVANCS